MINLYPQEQPHFEAVLAMTKDDVSRLRSLLSLVEEGKTDKTELVLKTFSSDGEGYDFVIQVLTDKQMKSTDPYYVNEFF